MKKVFLLFCLMFTARAMDVAKIYHAYIKNFVDEGRNLLVNKDVTSEDVELFFSNLRNHEFLLEKACAEIEEIDVDGEYEQLLDEAFGVVFCMLESWKFRGFRSAARLLFSSIAMKLGRLPSARTALKMLFKTETDPVLCGRAHLAKLYVEENALGAIFSGECAYKNEALTIRERALAAAVMGEIYLDELGVPYKAQLLLKEALSLHEQNDIFLLREVENFEDKLKRAMALQ